VIRTGIALLVLALAVPLLLPRLGIAETPRASGECTWKRHTKRIVKRVKRKGKVRRVVRVKRWWTCRRKSAPPALGGGLPFSPPGPPGPGEPEPTIARVSVKAFEYGYVLSRPSVAAGEVIVELNNQGEDPHNLNLRLEGGGPLLAVPEAPAQDRTLERFTLGPGAYRLWCSLEGHEQLGMEATLSVTGGSG
jgi:hypothetical protein